MEFSKTFLSSSPFRWVSAGDRVPVLKSQKMDTMHLLALVNL